MRPFNSGRSAKMSSAIFSVVPTGEVDSIMNKSPSFKSGITVLVADST